VPHPIELERELLSTYACSSAIRIAHVFEAHTEEVDRRTFRVNSAVAAGRRTRVSVVIVGPQRGHCIASV